MSINDKIKNEMNSRGWSVYQLSKRSKISKTAINGWFKEVPTKPNYGSLKQIAKAFGMSIEELVSENREVDSQKQRMLELWNRLEVEEKENVINIIKTILTHNK